jgi:hypothetical protein
MGKNRLIIWLSLLTGAVVILIIGVVIGVAALASDVSQLDEQVAALKFGGGGPAGASTDRGSMTLPSASNALKSTPVSGVALPNQSGSASAAFKAQIDGLSATSSGLVVSLTVQFGGPADLLYQPPIVRNAKGVMYTITPDSLKAARFAFLDLTTSGQASARFVFQPAPAAKEALTFVFNPTMQVEDAIAPRMDVVLRRGE